MKFIECSIPAFVYQPVYEAGNLKRVSDISCTPVVAWAIAEEILTPVTCMGVVYSDHIIKHNCSDFYFCPDTQEEFMYLVKDARDGKLYPSNPSKAPELMIQKFQMMRDKKL